MKRTLLYNSSPVELNGSPRDNRLLRRWDVFSRLFQFGAEITPVTAIAYNPYTGKLVLGFNSPGEDVNFDDHCKLLNNLVAERLELIKSYFNKEGRTNKIWDVVLKLGPNSRQSPGQPFEYSVEDIFADLPELYNALYPPEDPLEMIINSKDYLIELLVLEGHNLDTAEATYQRLLTNNTYRENHKFFRKDSIDRLFFSPEISAAFDANNLEIVIEPLINRPDKPAVVHAEVAVANHILLTGPGLNEKEYRRLPIGVSKLNCAHCANYFHMLNQIANDAHDDAEIYIPNFLVTGTHSCEFPNWGAVLVRWMLLNPQLAEIFKKYGLESLVTQAQESNPEQLSIKTSPKRTKIGEGIVPDPIQGSRAIAQSPLASPLDNRSPQRKKFLANNRTPEKMVRNYQRLNDELRIKISEKIEQKEMLLQEKQKLDSIHAKIKTVTSELSTAQVSGKKTLSKADIINEFNLTLSLVQDPEIKQCIKNMIACTALPNQVSPSPTLYKKYLQIINEDRPRLTALYASAALLDTVNEELTNLEKKQQTSEAELKNVNLSPLRDRNNNNNNNNNHYYSESITEKSSQSPGFGQMMPPTVIQKSQQTDNNMLNQWSFNPPAMPTTSTSTCRKVAKPLFN